MEGSSRQQLPAQQQQPASNLTRSLRRSRSFGTLRYRNADVKNLVEVNNVYEDFLYNLSAKRNKTYVENLTFVNVSGENNQVNVNDVKEKTEELLENIVQTEASLVLEVQQLHKLLFTVQRNIETAVAETSDDVKRSVESVKEMLKVHLDRDQRTTRMVNGIEALQAWVSDKYSGRLLKITFEQVPQEAKAVIQYVSTRYGDRKDELIRAFGVPKEIETTNTDDLCTRVLALWIKQDSKRDVRDLRSFLDQTNRLTVTAEMSKRGTGSRFSFAESVAGSEESFGTHSSLTIRRDTVTLEKVHELVTETHKIVQSLAKRHQHMENPEATRAVQV